MYDSMEPPFLTSQVSNSRILYQAGAMSCNCKHSSNDLMVNSLASCSYSGYVCGNGGRRPIY
jgi:succinate dehydrogenase/fumarate reductase flavoprotein subunit